MKLKLSKSSSKPSSKFSSRLFEGNVVHKRSTPVTHQFKYRVFWYYLDLDEIETICKKFWFWSFNRFNIISYFPKDYIKQDYIKHNTQNRIENPPNDSESSCLDNTRLDNTRLNNNSIAALKTTIRQQIQNEFGEKFDGKISVLTNLRYLGYVFNPVTFYFCLDSENNPKYIIALITNTPWGEKHPYLFKIDLGQDSNLTASKPENTWHEFAFSKCFHISPFNPIDMDYFWRFNISEQKIRIHMKCEAKNDKEQQQKDLSFNVSMALESRTLNQNNSFKFLFKYPLYTLKVISGIYWQAFILWIKKAPFYNHPKEKNFQ